MTTKGALLKSIRSNCLACCCQSVKEVSNCQITDCELHPFRMGTDPNPTRTGRNLKTPVTGDEFSQNEGQAIVKCGGV